LADADASMFARLGRGYSLILLTNAVNIGIGTK
jgi:hypothetical protein